MPSAPPEDTAPDVDTVRTRTDLGLALTALRRSRGLTVRLAAQESGVQLGTVTGWFAGNHVPTPASRVNFDALLTACGLTDPERRARWWEAVLRVRAAPRVHAGASPYKGLEPYTAEDAAVFHGRGRLVSAAATRVAAARGAGVPAVVVGPSGAGKSSLVRAGLLPTLVRPGGALAGWSTRVLTPGRDPVDRLAAALAGRGGPTVLVCDQLEELFTQAPDRAGAVLEELVRRAGETDLAVVLVLRADFYAEAAAVAALLPALAGYQVVVGAMDSAEVREAVVEPARRFGREVDADLLDALLADLGPTGRATGALPLLSHALHATWERAGARLTLGDYRATGSIAGAVAQSAEHVVAGLTEAQQDTARWVFLRLVSVDGPLVTRRVAAPAELDDGSGRVAEVLARFAAARLLTLDDDAVEVTHEALLTAWPRLRGWVDDYRDVARAHRRLARAAAAWREADRAPEYLLRGSTLAALDEWSTDPARTQLLNTDERELLAASLLAREESAARERGRTRRLVQLTSAAVVFGVLALVAALVATLAVGRADRQQQAAEQARDSAVAVQLSVQAAALRERDPNLAAQLAVAAYRTDPSVSTRSALLDSTADIVPARATGAEGPMAVALTQDGTVAVAARSDGSVTLSRLDPATAAPTTLATVVVDPGGLYAAAVAPGSPLLAVGGQGGRVVLLDVGDPADPRELGDGLAVGGAVRSLLWSADGALLAAAADDGLVHRWRVAGDGSATALAPVQETGAVGSAALSPDGRVLATGASDGTAKLWDVAAPDGAPTLLATLPTSTATSLVLALAFSPDGRSLAFGSRDRVVREVDVTDPRAPGPVRTFEGHGSFVNGVSYSPDGTRIAAAGSDNRTLQWDRATGELVTTLLAAAPMTAALPLPDGRTLVTASTDGVLRTWRLGAAPLTGAEDIVFTADVAAGGDLLVAGPGVNANEVLLWDTTDRTRPVPLPALTAPDGQRLDGALSVDAAGTLVAAGTATGGAALWDVDDPVRPRYLGTQETGLEVVQQVDLSQDGRLLVLAADPGTLVLWDLTDPRQPRETARLELAATVLDVEVSPDGRTVAATADAQVLRWDVTDPDAPRGLPPLEGFTATASSLAFSPDSTRLAAGGYDRSVLVWDVADGVPAGPTRLVGPAGSIIGTSYSPDGTLVAGASEDGGVWLWDTVSGATVARLVAGGGRVFTAPFSPDGTILVGFGAGDSQAGRVWTVAPEEAVRRICAGVGTPITEQEWTTYAVGVPYTPPCS